MKISVGTPEAMAVLALLRDEGDLVDVYSEDFFSRQPSFKEDPDALFNIDGMDYINALETHPESECRPKGHLLFIFLDNYKREIRRRIVSVYPPLDALIDNGKHNPDFLLLNLHTKQILCVGLGRKNGLFVFDAASGEPVDALGLPDCDDQRKYMEDFTEHDPYDATESLIRALHDLGVAMFQDDHEEATLWDVEHSLKQQPDEDGYYLLIDTSDNPLTDDLYTKTELSDLYNALRRYRKEEQDALRVINAFFPQCERGELSTGDY